MSAGASPCGGIFQDGLVCDTPNAGKTDPSSGQVCPDPAPVRGAVQGRFMNIALVPSTVPNGQTLNLPVNGLMQMYVLCWTDEEKVDTKNKDILDWFDQ